MNGMGPFFWVWVWVLLVESSVRAPSCCFLSLAEAFLPTDGMDGWMGRDGCFLYTYTYDEAQDRTGQDTRDFRFGSSLSTD